MSRTEGLLIASLLVAGVLGITELILWLTSRLPIVPVSYSRQIEIDGRDMYRVASRCSAYNDCYPGGSLTNVCR